MVNTGRDDFDQLIKIGSTPIEEPVFTVKARDRNAAKTARAWAVMYAEDGGSIAMVEQALQQADRLEAWPVKKLPDDDHLTPQARKHLAWQFRRRVWRGGIGPAAKHTLAAVFAAVTRTLEKRAAERPAPFMVQDAERQHFADFVVEMLDGLQRGDMTAADFAGALEYHPFAIVAMARSATDRPAEITDITPTDPDVLAAADAVKREGPCPACGGFPGGARFGEGWTVRTLKCADCGQMWGVNGLGAGAADA
jgi:hypothetical protein